jgi:hypothetical protein
MNAIPPDLVLGDRNNRLYHDAVGKPLAPGDLILYVTSASSSIYMNYSIIDEIVALDAPAYVGYDGGRRVNSWDKAFSLKVRKVDQDAIDPERFHPQRRWDRNLKDYVSAPLKETKLTTIRATQRVVKIENGSLDDR